MIEGEACNCLQNVFEEVWLQIECWYHNDKTYRDLLMSRRSMIYFSAPLAIIRQS